MNIFRQLEAKDLPPTIYSWCIICCIIIYIILSGPPLCVYILIFFTLLIKYGCSDAQISICHIPLYPNKFHVTASSWFTTRKRLYNTTTILRATEFNFELHNLIIIIPIYLFNCRYLSLKKNHSHTLEHQVLLIHQNKASNKILIHFINIILFIFCVLLIN